MRVLKFLLSVVVLGAVLVLAGGWYLFSRAPVAVPQDTIRITVPKGTSVRALATLLREQGVDVDPRLLLLRYRLRQLDGKLKAGVFELTGPQTIDSLLDRFTSDDGVLATLRIIEGWTFRQMRSEIAANTDLKGDTRELSDRAIMERIGAAETDPEGLFMPETYTFAPGTSDLVVYRQAYALMRERLDAAWSQRRADLPLKSPYEALVLASIVEKETGRPEDRTKVAAVFVNRLRAGMLLQSDPTTIYGMGERFDGNLRRGDLTTDTPHNTYTRKGLPPTPIALPGLASISATLAPADIDSLYFVARGDGTSEFSRTLSEHNRAVARYQLGRKN